MVVQLAVLALPGDATEQVQAALQELVEVACDGAGRDTGQIGDLGVGAAFALEPQHLHLLLDARVGMVVAVVANLVQNLGAEVEVTHGGLPGS